MCWHTHIYHKTKIPRHPIHDVESDLLIVHLIRLADNKAIIVERVALEPA